MKKAVFLDRDGVINKKPKEHDYVKNWDEFVLNDGVIETLKYFQKLKYLTVVVTNQAGVSKGFLTEATLQKIHSKLNTLLKKHGVKFNAIYYCPHQVKDNCSCRKPKTGMVDRAVKDLKIDLKNSWMVGDSDNDKNLGIAAGLKTIIIKTNSNVFNSIKNKIKE